MHRSCLLLTFALAAAACGKVETSPDAAIADAPRPIDANSELVTVNLTGTGTGTVSATPPLTCDGSTCTARVDPGTSMTITGTVSGTSLFTGWVGGTCTGTDPCTFTVNADVTIEAPFLGLNQTFAYTGSLQSFTVPQGVDLMVIEADGAQGGGSNAGSGGLGASMIGTYAVTPGDTWNIVVGQQGQLQVGGQTQNSSGGGGGTFVYDNNGTLLVAAGGGGGLCNFNTTSCATSAGQITPDAASSCTGGGVGGTGGNGGATDPARSDSGGGAGWLTAGGNGVYGGQNASGAWAGGQGWCMGGGGGCGGAGGYGGGGGGGNDYGGGGGGGGYSGGGGAGDPDHGGGGGSFSNGTNQHNTAGVQPGNGVVNLYW